MKQVIAFWADTRDDSGYDFLKFVGTVTLEDGKLSVDSDDKMVKALAAGFFPEAFVERFAQWSGSVGYHSKLLAEGEEPGDFPVTGSERIQYVPGEGLKVVSSYTVDENGLWHRDLTGNGPSDD